MQPQASSLRISPMTTHIDIDRLAPAHLLDASLRADLRSDHAGETGAVWIYRGILALARNPEVRQFALEHLGTEEQHLAFFESWLPRRMRSRMLPLWRLSGWMLGALSLLGGARGVFLTIDAVETFVVQHYQDQIDYLEERGEHRDIVSVLRRFQQDENHHRQDASGRSASHETWLARCWKTVVGEGSRLAVMAARRL